MMKTFKKITASLITVAIFIALKPDLALASLDNANIISDYNFSNANPTTAAEINNFLIANGSKLANYTIPEYIDVPYPLAAGGFGTASTRQINDLNGTPFYGKTVAQLIYDEATEHNVNSRVILATLQKESSAITGDVFRSSTVATWPMFYMYDETMASCLNSGINCNDSAYRQTSLDFGGIGRQLGYSIAWFGKKYYDYSNGGRCLPTSSNCLAREQYSDPVTIDGQSISCQTAGSRILYLYTPHIQTSFYNIFSGFFGDPASGVPQSNDTDSYSKKIYSGANVRIVGGKQTNVRAYFNGNLAGDIGTTTWEVYFTPTSGVANYAVIYKDDTDTEIGRKNIAIESHKQSDINGDNNVDITDLAIFAENWGKANPSEALADQNGDGAVDITDLAIFAENWGK